ncbi:MAG TPA: DUF4331 domain-containing protein [Pyrinomonadaceae bacterium]|nr:DUF4331 domain-containing protein [Pyrinomonadaceae bacterium]
MGEIIMKNILKKLGKGLVGLSLIASMSSIPALASSHAEAPLISMDRFADNTDTYAFRSVEPGREGFVTLIANYIPLQEPGGGPQYFRWDDTVLYEIKIDNTGDGLEDIKYQFQFSTQTLNGETILGQSTVNENGVIASLNDPDYNMPQTYTVRRVDSSTGRNGRVIAAGLRTPPANIGPRTTPNYEANLGQPAVYPLPNGGKVFAGNRDEYFYIDVGGVFDTLNLRSIGASGGVDTTQGYNVSTIAIEVPIQELTSSRAVPASPTASDAVVGVWATASRRTTRVIGFDGSRTSSGAWQQVSRLGNPLVNEVVIPLRLKDAFNSLSPVNDAVAAPYVLDPQLPRLLQAVYGIAIPPPPRNDLVSIFATGIPVNAVTGPNYTTFLSDGIPHEYLRLNVAIPITPIASINRLGLLGGDVAGFPNGRRPHDDVTDIALRAVAGGTPFTPATNVAPNNTLGDGVSANPEGALLTRFPYLLPPNPGNTPRTSNQTLSSVKERDWTKAPVVDSNGLFR